MRAVRVPGTLPPPFSGVHHEMGPPDLNGDPLLGG